MACGAGRVLADLVTGKRPEIDTEGLFMDRYGKANPPIVVPQEVRA